MKKLSQLKDLKSIIRASIKVLCVTLCVYYVFNILFLDTYSLSVYFQQKNELNRLRNANDNLVLDNKQLQEEIEKLKNDPHYIESLARRNYSMVKKGETVYVFKER